ncbi:MAG: capsule biosynthesis protein, partial [Paracoccaceae bacterium]
MTTKPSAKRYHIRRMVRPTDGIAARDAAQQAQPEADSPFEPVEDGFPANIFPPLEPQPKPVSQAAQPKKEPEPQPEPALTARQLRMARRVAQKHGIDGHDDHELVRKLREQGIDPFQRVNVLEMIKGEGARAPSADAPAAGLPQAWQGAPVPSPAQAAETARLHDIERIQQDIVRRRRHRFALMLARLAFFVLLPTLIAGLYYYVFATPLYATKSEFVIQQAQGGGSGGMGGLFAGTQFATSQDSITVQSYLQSRDAMLRLDADHGFKAHFSQPQMDALQRL